MPTRNPCVVGAVHVSCGACTGRCILFPYAIQPLLVIKQLVRLQTPYVPHLVGEVCSLGLCPPYGIYWSLLICTGEGKRCRASCSSINPYSIPAQLTDADVGSARQCRAGGGDDISSGQCLNILDWRCGYLAAEQASIRQPGRLVGAHFTRLLLLVCYLPTTDCSAPVWTFCVVTILTGLVHKLLQELEGDERGNLPYVVLPVRWPMI